MKFLLVAALVGLFVAAPSVNAAKIEIGECPGLNTPLGCWVPPSCEAKLLSDHADKFVDCISRQEQMPMSIPLAPSQLLP
jgi:hypothetical protein